MSKVIKNIKHYWLSLTVLILLAITFLSLHPLDNLPEAPGSDKTHHFISYAALAYPTALRKPNRWLRIIIFFGLYSGLIELIQPLVNRYGEWTDFLANISGIFIGITLAFLTNKLEKKPLRQ